MCNDFKARIQVTETDRTQNSPCLCTCCNSGFYTASI